MKAKKLKQRRIVGALTSIKLSNIGWLNRGGISMAFYDQLRAGSGRAAAICHRAAHRQQMIDFETGAWLN